MSKRVWVLSMGEPRFFISPRCHGPLGSCSPVCSLRVLCCVCGVLGHLAPVHRCACSVCCVARAVSSATWLLFTGVPAPSAAVLVRCHGPLGSCSPVCSHRVLCCVCGVLDHLAPVDRSACSVCCVARAVSWATWLLFTGVPAPSVAVLVRCHGPLGSCSMVCSLCVLCCVCGVLGHLAPVHQCVRSVLCFARAVSWATWLLFTGVPSRCAALRVRCGGPPGSCSPMCPLCALSCACGVLGLLAPIHRCARPVCCVACMVSWAPLTLVHQCARWVCCVWCAVSWASWLLFTGVLARCVELWAARAGRRCGAHTRPSRRRPFVACRGWVRCRARTRSSGWRPFVACRGWVRFRTRTHPS